MANEKLVTVEVLKRPLRKKGVKKAIEVGKTTTLEEDVAKILQSKSLVKIVTTTQTTNTTGDKK